MAEALVPRPLPIGPNDPVPFIAPIYDGPLLEKITPYLDRHMVLKVCDILQAEEGKTEKELAMLRWRVYDTTSHSNDAVYDAYALAHGVSRSDIPAAVKERIEARKARLSESEQKASSYITAIDGVMSGEISVAIDAEYVGPVPQGALDHLFAHARALYDSGFYTRAHAALLLHLALTTKTSSSGGERRSLTHLWGYTATAIMCDAVDVAAVHLRAIAEQVKDSPTMLTARLWLAHWGLFVFFRPAPGACGEGFAGAAAASAGAAAEADSKSAVKASYAGHADWFVKSIVFEERYRILAAVQAASPYLMRYLTVALVTSRLRTTGRGVLRQLTTALVQEQRNHNDSVCSFLRLLHEVRDISGAQAALRNCKALLDGDLFLRNRAADFIDGAWVLLFETFCRAHSLVSVDYVGEQLGLSAHEAERWVVGLIRDARLDARYDTEQRHIIMRTPQRSPITHLRERAKFLLSRTIQNQAYQQRNIVHEREIYNNERPKALLKMQQNAHPPE